MIFTLKDKTGKRRRIKQSEAVDDYISREQLEAMAEKLRGLSDEKYTFLDSEESLTVYRGHVPRAAGVNVVVVGEIRRLCALRNWYNAGTVPMYENMLTNLVPEGDPLEIARDVFANTRVDGSAEEKKAVLDEMHREIRKIFVTHKGWV